MGTAIGGQLLGTGNALPRRVVRNIDLPSNLDTTDEWIVQRTGIRERRICGPDETTTSLSLEASKRALAAASIPASEIDLIICATVTPETVVPATACQLQAQLGCRAIPAFDMNAACSGFLYAMAIADQFIQTGAVENALIVGADTLSRIVDFSERSTCVLFGDGAGAVVLGRGAGKQSRPSRYRLYSDGSLGDLIRLNGPGSRPPMGVASDLRKSEHYDFLRMVGREVFKFAVATIGRSIRDCLQAAELTSADIDLVIPHQVNKRILDAAFPSLGIPPEKLVVNLENCGNTSSASVPIALDEAVRAGRVRHGDTLLLIAFGGGMTWASAVVPYAGVSQNRAAA